jgi:cytochrome c-type biogenesis protein CcmH
MKIEGTLLTEFWLGATALLLLAAVFLLFPKIFLRARGVQDLAQSNRDWFETRRDELARSGDPDPELLQDARLRVLEDGLEPGSAGRESAADATDASSGPHIPMLMVLLLLLALGMYWKLGAGVDVQLARTLDNFSPESSEADYRRLMLQVEERSAQRPQNLHYQAMLGRFYMNEGDYARARDLYAGLAKDAPGDAGALALAAQARYLEAGRVLDQDSQLLAEQALSIDPHQRTALGLLGMAAYEGGEYQAAITYWRRLLVMEDPNSSSAQMIQGVIARAEAALGGDVTPSPHGESPSVADGQASAAAGMGAPVAAAAGGLGVSIRLELAADLAANPGDTVFVFARNPALESRMPVAVQRLTVAQLPATLRLDDAASMAGQKISELDEVLIIARVSPSGQPTEAAAIAQAQLGPLAPDDGSTTHALVLAIKKN